MKNGAGVTCPSANSRRKRILRVLLLLLLLLAGVRAVLRMLNDYGLALLVVCYPTAFWRWLTGNGNNSNIIPAMSARVYRFDKKTTLKKQFAVCSSTHSAQHFFFSGEIFPVYWGLLTGSPRVSGSKNKNNTRTTTLCASDYRVVLRSKITVSKLVLDVVTAVHLFRDGHPHHQQHTAS